MSAGNTQQTEVRHFRELYIKEAAKTAKMESAMTALENYVRTFESGSLPKCLAPVLKILNDSK